MNWTERPRLLATLTLAFACVPMWLAVVTNRDARQKDVRVFETTARVLSTHLQSEFERDAYLPRELRNRARTLDDTSLRAGEMMPTMPWMVKLPHLLSLGYAEVAEGKLIVRWKSEERTPTMEIGDDLAAIPGVVAALGIPQSDPSPVAACVTPQRRMLLLIAQPGLVKGSAVRGYMVGWVDLLLACRDPAVPLIRDEVLQATPLLESDAADAETQRAEMRILGATWTAGITRGARFNNLYGPQKLWFVLSTVALVAVPLLLAALAWVEARKRERLQAQAARLLEVNELLTRFKAIADTTSDFVGMSEVDMTVSYLNPAGRALLGFAADEPIDAFAFNKIYSARTLEIFEGEAMAHAMNVGPWSGEITLVHRDGREIPVSFVGFIVKSPEGLPLHFGCIARDIRNQHEMDRQLRESIEHHRELVRIKSQLVNTVSHEFRTPLGIILSGAELLESYDSQITPERRSELFTEIKENTHHMTEMIESVLMLGRIESSRLVCNPQPIGIAVLCSEVAHKVTVATAGRSEIIVKVPACEALLDASILSSVLGNLLSNAVKYSPPGKPVTLEAILENERLIFIVRDEGIGIPEHDVARVCEPFHRCSNVGEVPGTGLGLAIVQRCAELHGGTLAIESTVGTGTTATVIIPIL